MIKRPGGQNGSQEHRAVILAKVALLHVLLVAIRVSLRMRKKAMTNILSKFRNSPLISLSMSSLTFSGDHNFWKQRVMKEITSSNRFHYIKDKTGS